MTAYPNLFSPITIGTRTLRNRVVHAAMSTYYADKQRATDKLIGYFVNRARGGAALLVTEPMSTLHWHKAGNRPGVFSGVNDDVLPRWADAVAAEGAVMVGQIQDGGRGSRSGSRNPGAYGASALPDDISWTVPHAMTAGDIRRMIDEWTFSATKLRDAGWGGVELSAGHGHMFHQFMSPWSNVREDAYGGDFDGRMRLITELLASLRSACGPDFIIGVKLPGEDGVPGSIDMDLAGRITAAVHATGVPSYITYCWGTHADTLYEHLPDLYGPRTPYVDKIHELGKHAPGTPIGQLGLITDPNEGERIIRDGLGDLVMLGRPLVTDPAWPIKAEQGREPEIRYCVSCNTCWAQIHVGGPIACDNNPRVGESDEADWQPPKAEAKRKVVIVGSGIAGMEAAWVAAGRGHDVTVFGAGDEPGGKTRLHALLPGGENYSSIYDYQRLRADKYGATFRFGERAALDDILALQPDHVVLATGSTPRWPAFLPEEYKGEGFFPDLREAAAMMVGFTQKQPGVAVIHDEDHGAFTYAFAELLLERFDRVVLLTPRERIASDAALVIRQQAYIRLYRGGCEIVTSVRPLPTSRFEEGEVTYANIYSGQETTITDVALFTYGTSRIPDDALAAPLRAAGIDVTLVGDAQAPRTVLWATAEGYRAGMEV